MLQFDTVRVVSGKFQTDLAGKRGEVDVALGDGSVVITFRNGTGDDATRDSYLVATTSVQVVPRVERIVAEKEIERSIGLRDGFTYV